MNRHRVARARGGQRVADGAVGAPGADLERRRGGRERRTDRLGRGAASRQPRHERKREHEPHAGERAQHEEGRAALPKSSGGRGGGLPGRAGFPGRLPHPARADEIRGEAIAGGEGHGNVVFSTGGVGGVHQALHQRARVPGVRLHDARDLGRGHHVGEAVAAHQDRVLALQRKAQHFDEVHVARTARLGAHRAVDFVASRVTHRLALRQLAVVLAHPDWRMVVRDLVEAPGVEPVEPRVAHVPHRDHALLDQRQREHATHAFPRRILAAEARDLVVRRGDRFAHAVFGRPTLSAQPFEQARHRRLRRDLSRGGAAHPVDHDQQATRGVDVEPVLVALAHESGMTRARVAHGARARGSALVENDDAGRVRAARKRHRRAPSTTARRWSPPGRGGRSSAARTAPSRRQPALEAQGDRLGETDVGR